MRVAAPLPLAIFCFLAASCNRVTVEPTAANRGVAEQSDTSGGVETMMSNSLHGLAFEPQSVRWLSDLKLVRDGTNPNDPARPIALPGSLAPADFGFFDDAAILRQLPRAQLIAMAQGDFGFRFVADLDHDGKAETYRLGWLRLPGQAPVQFLAVEEDHTLRDVWTSDADELLGISWRHGRPTVFSCNCPANVPIVYAHGKLHLKTSE